ncbi:hypothetical protein B0G80_5905 [Paraburkholderia sp. BL6669N2]|uniref:hypothetical protein n=1 Tax=Paraburkholderia sp. BL6669N2 TaxID=1938807 RepID=UPI000E23F8B9|nr:hypothetical protein [Paraburkholderia sp. BL6669N2]REG49531.1 hypothetical protein B0G80_5905 [Paraburkholderia sp. BL6669N2]
MKSDLYPTFEYALRAQRLHALGLSPERVEQCSGIPHNLIDTLLPGVPGTKVKSNDFDAATRQALLTLSEHELLVLKAAMELRSKGYAVATGNSRVIPVSIEEATDLARASSVKPTADSAGISGYLGLHERPLQMESSTGILFRFAEFNAINVGAAARVLGVAPLTVRVRRAKPTYVGFDFLRLPANSAWRLLPDQRLHAELPMLAEVILRRRFAFCPDCMAARYHSVAHQLTFVTECPLHHVKILQECKVCGEPTSTIGAMATLTGSSRPFVCRKCGSCVDGNSASFSRYKQFRHEGQALENSFTTMLRWLESAQEKLWPLEQILSQRAGLTEYLRAVLLDTVQRLHPPPTPCSLGSATDVTILRWEQRLVLPGTSDTEIHDGCHPIEPESISLVYRSTLESLHGFLPPQDSVSSEEWEVVIGALYDFRRVFEGGTGQKPRWSTGSPQFRRIDQRQVGSRLQRAAARAFMLGVFTEAYRTRAAAMKQGIPHVRGQTGVLNPRDQVPIAYLPDHSAVARQVAFSEGLVVFRSPANFDMDRIWPSVRAR